MSKITEVLDNKCPHCGGKADYNPTTNKWKCNYCSSEMTLEEMQKFNNAIFCNINITCGEKMNQINSIQNTVSYYDSKKQSTPAKQSLKSIPAASIYHHSGMNALSTYNQASVSFEGLGIFQKLSDKFKAKKEEVVAKHQQKKEERLQKKEEKLQQKEEKKQLAQQKHEEALKTLQANHTDTVSEKET